MSETLKKTSGQQVTAAEIEAILRDTLHDSQLTRRERKDIVSRIHEATPTASELATYRGIAFKLAAEAVSEPSRSVVEWLEGVNRQFIPNLPAERVCQAFFSPGDDCVGRIIGMLRTVRQTLDLCIYTISDDRIKSEILNAHRRGVVVRIISDPKKSNDMGSDVVELRHEGIATRFSDGEGHMHHKFAIFDGREILTGSYNWTYGAGKLNYENIVICDDPRLAQQFSGEFERLWQLP